MSSPIGGFMPIPLAMMLPFMAAQSMLIGDAFGKAFQFGKRKISAMSNEEFNALTVSQMANEMQTEFKSLIPTLQQSIQDSKELQNTIITEMIKIVPEFLSFISGGITTTSQPSIQKEQSPFETTVETTTARTPPKRPTTKTTREIDSATRNKLMQHYRNTIFQLMGKLTIAVQTTTTDSDRKKQNVRRLKEGHIDYLSLFGTLYNELAQQKKFLANVTNWKKPY